MKPTKLLFLFLAIATALLTSCSNGPSSSDWERYRAEMLRYFPYQIGDTCIFENTDKDSSIVFSPFDENNGSFPQSYINIANCGSFEKCGASEVDINALWYGSDDKKANVTMIMEHGGGNNMEFYCRYTMWLGRDYEYSGITVATYPMAEVLSYIRDTLVLPISRYDFPTDGGRSHIDISSKGAYLRFVKDHGMTDFSLDGTTVWHQVEK